VVVVAHQAPHVVRQLRIILCLISALLSGFVWAEPTQMTVMVVYGAPGHSSIHLKNASGELYWDPGGAFGTEYDDCREDSSEKYCQRFAGFPWHSLKNNRKNDVFMGDSANLMRVISTYHLDGDDKTQIYQFQLNQQQSNKAWAMLGQNGTSDFETDRNPMFCVKAVTEFLENIGGQFTGIKHPWYPEELGQDLIRLGAKPNQTFSIEHEAVQNYVQQTRQKAGLPKFDFTPKAEVVHTDPMSMD
jgi:hypothetical protein